MIAALYALASGGGTSVTPLLYVIGALLAGGLLNLGWQVYRRWRSGGLDDRKTIEETIEKEIGGLRSLVTEYRTEAEVTKRLLDEYRQQLTDVTKDLARAQVRIGYLEDELRSAQGQRTEVEKELHALKVERESDRDRREELLREGNRLRERVAQLEAMATVTEGLLRRERDGPPEQAN